MPKLRYWTARISWTAKFSVICELCDHRFSFEQHYIAEGTTGGMTELPSEPGAAAKAQGNLWKEQKSLLSGHFDIVKPHSCPCCGYFQSWMRARAKAKYAPGKGLGVASALTLILSVALSYYTYGIQYTTASIPWAPVFAGALLLLALSVAGVTISVNKYRKFDPNEAPLRNRPSPVEERKPDISLRLGD